MPLGKAPSGRLSTVSTAARIVHGFNREQETSWNSYLAVPPWNTLQICACVSLKSLNIPMFRAL